MGVREIFEFQKIAEIWNWIYLLGNLAQTKMIYRFVCQKYRPIQTICPVPL